MLAAYGVEIDNVRISVSGASATVACRVKRTFTPKVGKANEQTVPTVFHLQKVGSSWVITSVDTR